MSSLSDMCCPLPSHVLHVMRYTKKDKMWRKLCNLASSQGRREEFNYVVGYLGRNPTQDADAPALNQRSVSAQPAT